MFTPLVGKKVSPNSKLETPPGCPYTAYGILQKAGSQKLENNRAKKRNHEKMAKDLFAVWSFGLLSRSLV